jgi:hypothetical protein
MFFSIGARCAPAVPIHPQAAMKKSQRPFTFEVKRGRLPSRQASTFQRYVVPDRAEARKFPEILLTRIEPVADVTPAASEGRVLPDLSRDKVQVEAPIASMPAAPDPIESGKVLDEPEILDEPKSDASIDEPVIVSPAAPLHEEQRRPKKIRRRGKTLEDLPRGERWKRRIPQAAW